MSEEESSSSLINSGRYNVRLATTEHELREAQALRYRVFNVELNEGLEESHSRQLDVDKYDSQCDHLLVIEQKTDTVIGTYRLQTWHQAREQHGFYTENEFDFSSIPKKIVREAVEAGRVCINKEHRNGRVLFLLWRGIAQYMKRNDARYLLGCCSLSSTNPADGWRLFDYLKDNGHLHPRYRIETKHGYVCPRCSYEAKTQEEGKPPQLFRLYLDLGAKVLSGPALDREFKTIDFCILVDVEELSEQAQVLFFR